MTELMYLSLIAAGVVALIVILQVRRRMRKLQRRRDSLSYNPETGFYTWTGMDGLTHRSRRHPDTQSSGAWHGGLDRHNPGGDHGGLPGGFDGGGGDGGGGGD